jgi:hypothetical protein
LDCYNAWLGTWEETRYLSEAAWRGGAVRLLIMIAIMVHADQDFVSRTCSPRSKILSNRQLIQCTFSANIPACDMADILFVQAHGGPSMQLPLPGVHLKPASSSTNISTK